MDITVIISERKKAIVSVLRDLGLRDTVIERYVRKYSKPDVTGARQKKCVEQASPAHSDRCTVGNNADLVHVDVLEETHANSDFNHDDQQSHEGSVTTSQKNIRSKR